MTSGSLLSVSRIFAGSRITSYNVCYTKLLRTYKQNPIIAAFLSGADHCADLDPAKIRETEINEPLVNWHSIDGDLALAAVRDSGGWADYASDRALSGYSRLLRMPGQQRMQSGGRCGQDTQALGVAQQP